MDENAERLRRKLTVKQFRFALAYITTARGNGTLACRQAGYQGGDDALAVQAVLNLQNPKIQQFLSDYFVVPAMMTVNDALSATKREYFLTKGGDLLRTEPEPDWQIRLRAAESVQKARRKGTSLETEQEVDDDLASLEEDLGPADRDLLRHASTIESQLAEIEGSNDGGDFQPIDVHPAPEGAENQGGEDAIGQEEDSPPADEEHVGDADGTRSGPMQVEASNDAVGDSQPTTTQAARVGNLPEVATGPSQGEVQHSN